MDKAKALEVARELWRVQSAVFSRGIQECLRRGDQETMNCNFDIIKEFMATLIIVIGVKPMLGLFADSIRLANNVNVHRTIRSMNDRAEKEIERLYDSLDGVLTHEDN